jgi:RNA polymerase sigma-70 factor (ECF subfamily)
MGSETHPAQPIDSAPAAATFELLTAARAGDARALDDLFARYVPGLRQWASGRLPGWARDLNDTHDLVQETVFRVFRNLEGFEYRGEGALKAYLRQALMNRIRNELRRAQSRPVETMLDSGIEDHGLSPFDAAVGVEARERYESALERLQASDRELIIARVELGLTYQEIADLLQRPSADAARMAIGRALVQLAKEMGRA